MLESMEPMQPAAAPRSPAGGRAAHLFHPLADFLLVGGVSAVLLPAAWLLDEAECQAILPALGSAAIVLATLINYPHFAHSYQLLYEGFGAKVFGAASAPCQRLRYAWSGILAPALIAAALVGACRWGGARALGEAANAMSFLVGWHYVKQGYGVLLVLSTRLGAALVESERVWLKRNAYAVWIYSWAALNRGVRESTLLGVTVRTLDVPEALILASGACAIVTTSVVAAALVRRLVLRRQAVSVSGLVAYFCALYLWVVARYSNPVFALLVPVFHSLQYLPFVWRSQLDGAGLEPSGTANAAGRRQLATSRLAVFVAGGTALGWLGFVGVPDLLQQTIAPDPAVFGPSAWAFLFFVSINVHHYFIDNVIWRRDDETARRLLAPS
jgi:hypothetical protein